MRGEIALVEVRHLENAVLALPLAVQEVAQRVRAAADLQAVLLAVADAVRRRFRIVVQVVARDAVRRARLRHDLRDEALHGVGGRRVGRRRRAGAPGAIGRRVRVVVDVCALLGRVGQLRTTRDTALRRDDDDAVRGVGAVQRRCRRTTYHFDRLDLFGIQIVDARGGRSADAQRRRARGSFDARSVDDVDRIVRQRERARSANTNAGPRARLRAGNHQHARSASREHVGDVRHRGARNGLRGIDLRNGVADFHATLIAGRRRDDGIQRETNGRHLDVERDGLPGGDRHRQPLFGVAHAKRAHFGRAGVHSAKGVLSLVVGLRYARRADDADLHRRNRESSRGIGDTATDGALLPLCTQLA